MLFVPKNRGDHRNLAGYTLILPSVSVGNVGQLAVDLLITNLTTEKDLALYGIMEIERIKVEKEAKSIPSEYKEIISFRSIGSSELEERIDDFGNKHRFLSGAGFVKHFMDVCDLPVIALFKFVDEGDNTQDAVALVNYLNAWKKLIQSANPTWKAPFSWRNMFGGPAPNTIY
ncbi:proteasome assembly chaperone 2 [Panulirus ornatus]|uniref:proteasome assembly chaperone 2 n=1 Tax=Panulirus ornatus TaxID=150431 RepID=UPI003A8A71E6